MAITDYVCVSTIRHLELAPDFDVVDILFQMLGNDGVGIAADCCTTVAEDSGNALKLVPQVGFDIQSMTIYQLCRRKKCSLKLGEIRFALLLADTLLFRQLGYGGCLLRYLFIVKQIVSIGRGGAVNIVIAVNCGSRVDRVI